MSDFEWHKEAKLKWEEHADFWYQKSQEMWDHGSRKTIVPFIEKHIPKGSLIGDLGCGDGYGSYKLHKSGYRIIGLDLSDEMIEKAKKRGSKELTFMQGDLTDLPFGDESFSGLMAINSLEWTEEPIKALNEMKRVLRTGHYLCVGLLGPTASPRHNSYRRLYGESVICNTLMPWELEKLASENGWDVIDGTGVYKQSVSKDVIGGLSVELKQALTFMWLFCFRKK
ncbi:class I SAM-dependent methyltransferase [Aquibacillus kalidii]|uniref:class I SAM-dependent methyltransferase n=1 Tax=Aquibacillus kalidii TaxID=2762597 RepID=UPI001646E1FF|nr:class I SAM-dependent methyltransferase [Aquibacillus kalidii]